MKTTLYALAFVFGLGGALQAQNYGADSARCRENLYIYYELAKKKQYIEAYESWQVVYEICPASSKNNFIYGPYIVSAKIKEAKAANDAAAGLKFKNLLMDVYDGRNTHYPGKEGYVASRKALDMLKYFPDSIKGSHDLFKLAIDLDGPEQSAAFYNYYFVTAAKLFNKKTFTVEDVFQAYNVVMEGIEVNTNGLNLSIAELVMKRDTNGIALEAKETALLEKAERELGRYTKVESNIEKILGPIATCEKLNLIYNDETFAANKADTVWLKRAAKMLQKERKNKEGDYEDCTENAIFFSISEELYKLQPSAPSARGMFVMAYKGGDLTKATAYIKEAIDYEIDPLRRSNDYYKLAQVYIKRGNLPAAKSAVMQATNSNRSNGDAYVLWGQIYASADGKCGNDVFEKKAVYWAAIDKLNYAKSIDASVTNKANRYIKAYKEQLPSKTILFQLGKVEGEQYTIGCWINETITIAY
jgi:tetratricopeptide (TPR) repeat protein